MATAETSEFDDLRQARVDASKAAFRALNSVVEPAVKAGIANPLPLGGGAIVLETIGHRSGKKRRVPLLAARVCNSLMVSTVRGDSHWLRNVEGSPDVTVWLDGKPRAATAEVRRGPLNTVQLTLV